MQGVCGGSGNETSHTQLERFPNCVAECCPDYTHTQFCFSVVWEWLFIPLLEIMEISHDLAEGLPKYRFLHKVINEVISLAAVAEAPC